MSEISLEEKMRYYSELALRLKGMGFGFQGLSPLNYLMVDWQGKPLCQMNVNGECRYQASDVSSPERESAKNRVVAIGHTVAEYMRLMEQAPQLKASGLEEGFRLLAEFNDVVLAGRSTRHGVQFVTWARDFDKKGVCWGHYFDEDFESAKQDFATRAGLVPPDRLLSSEQLVEVFRSIHETLESEYPLTREREQLLKETAAQVERAVPNLDELVQKSNEAELIQGQAEYPGMTQQF